MRCQPRCDVTYIHTHGHRHWDRVLLCKMLTIASYIWMWGNVLVFQNSERVLPCNQVLQFVWVLVFDGYILIPTIWYIHCRVPCITSRNEIMPEGGLIGWNTFQVAK